MSSIADCEFVFQLLITTGGRLFNFLGERRFNFHRMVAGQHTKKVSGTNMKGFWACTHGHIIQWALHV